MLELAEKLRDGSEGPFARALDALCGYALHDEDALSAPLDELRVVDAKHALAYTLNRAAAIDLARGRHDLAVARATEALECAEILERASERLLAHATLARAHAASGQSPRAKAHLAAVAAMEGAPVAQWARQHAAAVSERRSRRKSR
jgi:hypothetical protein